jgi:hypothetical protein
MHYHSKYFTFKNNFLTSNVDEITIIPSTGIGLDLKVKKGHGPINEEMKKTFSDLPITWTSLPPIFIHLNMDGHTCETEL